MVIWFTVKVAAGRSTTMPEPWQTGSGHGGSNENLSQIPAAFASIFAAAYVARILIVPDVVPIAEGEQSGWQIDIAFFLTSVQNIGLLGVALVVLLALSYWVRNLVAR